MKNVDPLNTSNNEKNEKPCENNHNILEKREGLSQVEIIYASNIINPNDKQNIQIKFQNTNKNLSDNY